MKAVSVMVSLAVCLALSGCIVSVSSPPVRVEREVEVVQGMEPGRLLTASTSNGDITVSGWGDPRCHVRARISARGWSAEEAQAVADAVNITITEMGPTTAVQVEKPQCDLAKHIGVSFDISVPRQSSIDVHTSNGNVAGRDLAGMLKGRTSNGSITSEGVTGPLDMHTSNGNVRCLDVMADVKAQTSNGEVHIRYASAATTTPNVEARTSNGGVTFIAPPNLSAQVTAETSNGSVTTDLPILVQGKISKNHLHGTIGDGQGHVSLRTSNGSIRIR